VENLVELSRTSPSLEAELAEAAERTEPGRTARIAVRYWGWDGRGGATLEATGREFDGITRERVRQLCERLALRLRGAVGCADARGTATPMLERALLVAAHVAPTTAKALAQHLADEHVSTRPFDPEGLLMAAQMLGLEATFSLQTVKDVRVVLPNPPDPTADTSAVIAAILSAAHAIVRRSGAARVRDVTGRVAATLAVWVDDELVAAVISEHDGFVWLERRTGWFLFSSVAKNSAASRVMKVLSVVDTIGIDDLHEGIRRDERMKEFVMPEYILAELCRQLPGVIVEDGRVRADRQIDPRVVLEATEATFLSILEEHGGAMERRELESRCRAEGMKASSFNNRIAYSPILADLGHGVYGLRGRQRRR
jgi:hypothetical protein